MKGFFITGTDTGVGKTMVTASLLAVLRAAGIAAAPFKPIQTGAIRDQDGRLRSPDLECCLNAVALNPEPACSPHLAAEQAGAAIDRGHARKIFDKLSGFYEFILAEGAGGVLAPISRSMTMLDLMKELGLPVLLVARSGLGTLNHTLLSLAAIRDAGMDVAGVVINDANPAEWGAIEHDNPGIIERLGGTRIIGRIPHIAGIDGLRRDPSAFLEAVAPALPTAAQLCAAAEPVVFDEIREMDRASLWHPYTKRSAVDAGQMPIIARGSGVYLEDVSGRRFLDAVSSWWACALGHGHPRLLRAMREQAGRLQHSILGNLSHPPAAKLAARLAALTGGNRHVLFASDGACAVEAAIKIAFQYWRNRGIAGRVRLAAHAEAYHGDTLGAMAAGFLPAFHAPFADIVTPAIRVQPPDCHPCRWGSAPGNCNMACFAPMQQALEEHGHELAAVIVEPLCRGSAGMRMYSPAYLKELAVACRKHDVLLIVDEVAMGFGRTGRMFACEHAGIEPDILCLGKALSGGCFPISATVAGDHIYDTFRDANSDTTFYHGHTFSGHPVAAATAIEALNIYEQERIPERAEALGYLLRERLCPLAAENHVKSVRCLGLIGAVELGPEPADGARKALTARDLLLEQGVLIRPLGAVLYLMPPLVISENELTWLADKLVKAVAQAVG